MGKIGRKEACPCGSGKKYKKCCQLQGSTHVSGGSQVPLQQRLTELAADPRFSAQDDTLHEAFFGPAAISIERFGDIAELALSVDAFKTWVLFDVPRDDGSLRVDEILRAGIPLSPGDRQFLSLMRGSWMGLYEVVDLDPAEVLTLRDVLGGHLIPVEASFLPAQLQCGDLVAARLVLGPAGLPMVHGGFLPQFGSTKAQQRAELEGHLAELRRQRPRATAMELNKALPPYFHRRWQDWCAEQHRTQSFRELEVIDDAEVARSEAERDAEELRQQRHFARWIHEQNPALNDLTPLQAAKEENLRPRLIAKLKELEDRYEIALRDQRPAFDPSWLRQQLDLPEDKAVSGPLHPPPLGHEVLAEGFSGLKEVVRTVVERLRRAGDRIPRTYSRLELGRDPTIRRYVFDAAYSEALRRRDDSLADAMAGIVAPLELCCNFELHLRKIFWVDERLSWTLGVTDSSVAGDMLRLPFPAIALVFTDRYALGLAERLVSRMAEDPRQRRTLRAVTAYVIEFPEGDRRRLRLFFACDVPDLRGPFLVQRDLWIEPGASLDRIVHEPVPGSKDDEDPLFACAPLKELLRLVINAILHATSAESAGQRRDPPQVSERTRRPGPTRKHYSSESVHFLPGKIEITLLRRIQQVLRGGGGELLHQSLVRGHFRGPNPDGKDQRVRFIEPYWRGPEDAAIVEREYRLKH